LSKQMLSLAPEWLPNAGFPRFHESVWP